MKISLSGLALAASLAAVPAASHATIVNVAGYITGCTDSSRCGGQHPGPGAYIGPLINPVQVSFGPGTYTVTNGVGMAGATPGFDAWNFNAGSPNNYIWAFIIIDDATKTVVLDSLPDPAAFVGDHASVASSAYALNYSGSFTLSGTRLLDFITEDYYPYDNLGGVALNIQGGGGVPEPATWALMLAGFGLLGATLRRRTALRISA
jgi:hypothetical protein